MNILQSLHSKYCEQFWDIFKMSKSSASKISRKQPTFFFLTFFVIFKLCVNESFTLSWWLVFVLIKISHVAIFPS